MYIYIYMIFIYWFSVNLVLANSTYNLVDKLEQFELEHNIKITSLLEIEIKIMKS